jgi:hypothetical protein
MTQTYVVWESNWKITKDRLYHGQPYGDILHATATDMDDMTTVSLRQPQYGKQFIRITTKNDAMGNDYSIPKEFMQSKKTMTEYFNQKVAKVFKNYKRISLKEWRNKAKRIRA